MGEISAHNFYVNNFLFIIRAQPDDGYDEVAETCSCYV
jgi:hypothetical protein